MKKYCNCGGALTETMVPRYGVPRLGIPVVLIDTVKLFKCSQCGKERHELPDLCMLLSAAATSRAINPRQLCGTEIRFIRKTLGLRAIEFAEILNATFETVSRWENDKLTNMSTDTEKLIRLIALNRLGKDDVDLRNNIDRLIDMDIKPPKGKPVPVKQEIRLPQVPTKGKKSSPKNQLSGAAHRGS